MPFLFFQRFFLLACVMLCGCAKLSHLQELLTLKAYSDNKTAQETAVLQHDARFDQLVAAVQNPGLDVYPDQKSFLKAFGPPVLRQPVEMSGVVYERWLYRYSTRYFTSDKVYIYFDPQGRRQKWEYVPLPTETSGAPAPAKV